ncbi:hypothetical protein OXX79_009942, partial [Metschnikowia pulcherrima]
MLDFWVKYLDTPTLSVLPHDFLKPLNNRSVEATKTFSVANADFVTGLAIFAALIFRLSGDDDVIIATDASSQGEPFVIRVSVDAKMSFSQLLAKVQHEYDNNSKKVDYHNLDDIARAIRQEKQLEANPALFKVSLQHARAS